MADPLRLEKEVRFAVVMYGGVSLAIYINGVSQELMSMVRATARQTDEQGGGYHRSNVSGVEHVYRQLGETLGARFVVDILSGTSAGGINAVYLAKALANDQPIDQLREMWISEGDIAKLVNDRESLRGLDGLAAADAPQSLLNSQRMYFQLLKALQGMETANPSSEWSFSPYVDELDLFITATDLHGQPVPVRSSGGDLALERRFRNVFQFRYCTADAAGTSGVDAADKPLNEFLQKHDPFLAFAARCTSSFPFAFEPMRLQQVQEVLASPPFRKYKYNTDEWSGFYRGYDAASFPGLSFGDGGYLDNKPFSYATSTLSRRRADVSVDRKLVYIEPAPEHIDDMPGAVPEPPDPFANVVLALTTLPRYETIREDLQAVTGRNRVIRSVNAILHEIETIYTLEDRDRDKMVTREAAHAQKARPPWRSQFMIDMIETYGASYIPYHALRVEQLLNNLTATFARGMGWEEDGPQATDLLALLQGWRAAYYKSSAKEADPRPEIERKPENDLVFRLDTGWYIRRLHYLRGLIDTLLRDLSSDHFQAPGSRSKSILDHSGGEWVVDENNRQAYHSALVWTKSKLNDAYTFLRGKGRAMRSRNLVSGKSGSNAPFEEYRAQLKALKELLESKCPDEGPLPPQQARTAPPPAPESKDPPSLLEVLTRHSSPMGGAVMPKPHLETDYYRALRQVEDLTATLTDPSRQGLIYEVLHGTSNRIQWALGRTRLAPGEEQPAANPLLRQVQKCLSFYDDRFEEFDMLTFPITYGTDVGESDEVEIVRISPDDADRIKGKGKGGTKLAGTKLGNFGAFFHENWRENDMLWGRLDGAECLIKAVWPPEKPLEQRDAFIDAAHKVIIEEFLLDKHRIALFEKYYGYRRGQKKDVEQAIARLLSDKDRLVETFKTEYKPDPDFPSEPTLRALARSTSVLGKLMGGLSRRNELFSQPARLLMRLGRTSFFVVSVAISDTFPNLLFKRAVMVAYLLGFGILTLGTLMGAAAWSKLGAQVVLGTLLVQLVVLAVSGLMLNRWNLKSILRTLANIVVAGIVLAFLLLSYSGLVYLGALPAPGGGAGAVLEALKRLFGP